MNAVMEAVVETIVARGEVTRESISAYLAYFGDEDATIAYENAIVPGINKLEDAIKASRGET